MNIRLNSIALAVIASTALFSTPLMVAQAQEGTVLEEVIVTAQKREENVQEIPVSVTSIGTDLIEKLGIYSTQGVVEASASVNMIQSNTKSNSSFSIRGIGTNVAGVGVEHSVAMIVDDVALPSDGQSTMGLFDVERIEVLRGPQSTLFGKTASAGLINIITKGPAEEFEGGVELSFTDETAYEMQGSISGPISDSLAYRLTGHWADRDGFAENLAPGQPDLGGTEAEGVRAKLRWQPSETVVADLSLYYTEESDNQCCAMAFRNFLDGTLLFGFIPLPGDYLRGISPSDSNTKVRVDDPPNATTETEGAILRLSFDVGEFNLLSITAWDSWEHNTVSDLDWSDTNVLRLLSTALQFPFQLNGGFANEEWREQDFFSQEFRLVSPITDRYDYLLGLYYSDSDTDVTINGNIPIAIFDYDGNSGNEYLGIFGQLNWRFNEKAGMSLGLRYFEEEISASVFNRTAPVPATVKGDSDDSDIVGKLSFQYQPSDNTLWFASYARGYKGQAFDINPAFNEFQAGNPIAPETSDAFELGFKGTLWDQRLQLNITAFQATYDDFQTEAWVFENGLFRYELGNAGELETQGIELESLALLSETLQLTFNATYVDSEVNDLLTQCWISGQTEEQGCIGGQQPVDGGTVPNSPEWKYTVMLDYRQPLNAMPIDLIANISYRWQDDVLYHINQNPNLFQDSHGVTIVRAGIADKQDRYELTAFINNAFDEDHVGQIGEVSAVYGSVPTFVNLIHRNTQRYWGVKAKFNF